MNRQELNLNELENVNGGFDDGQLCTVHGTENFLGFRNDYCYDDDNIIRRYHNGAQLIYHGKAPNGYALVEDPDDGKLGYVNVKYLK